MTHMQRLYGCIVCGIAIGFILGMYGDFPKSWGLPQHHVAEDRLTDEEHKKALHELLGWTYTRGFDAAKDQCREACRRWKGCR